jgi:hypothetical protein
MTPVPFVPRRPLDLWAFLRGAGVALSLPLLDAMTPAFGAAPARRPAPRRLVAVQTTQGIMPHLFFPEKAGADYPPSPYLALLKEHRRDFTVFSGVSHPGVDGGHANEKSFLTAAPHPAGGGFRNTASLDQYAADRVGAHTRFRSLVLEVRAGAGNGMSFSAAGVAVPAEGSPTNLYKQLFIQGDEAETAARLAHLREGRSLLDSVLQSARNLGRDLGARDRGRLDQYFTAIRGLEGQLKTAGEWARKPKPKVSAPMPEEIKDTARLLDRLGSMLGVVRLALETDSARVVSLYFEPLGVLSAIPGVRHETHSLTHHGNRPEMIAELRKIEEAQFRVLAGFLGGLKAAREGPNTLLDQTIVLYGSCMGNANGHTNTNWPVLLAGGGFRHGRHLAFDRERNYPLANLCVSVLRRLGVEADRFASGTGTMRGLEPV